MNVFISQPMNGLTDEQIKIERERAIRTIEKFYPTCRINIIPSFLEGADRINPVFCLGLAISKMADADLVVFCLGWSHSRGCMVEHEICKRYDIDMDFIEDMEDELLEREREFVNS